MLTLMDWFCGAGGSSQGAHAVPGVEVARAANHWDKAIASHAANFPHTDHWKGDIREAPVDRWPVCDLFWASPECTKWSLARGKKRTFHRSLQDELIPRRKTAQEEEEERSRALMNEVPQYLAGVRRRGGLVLAGVVENVIDEREWDQWDRWLNDIRILGYNTRVIAFNSMHAEPVRTLAAPQSRDRLYVAYWHQSLGRDPDWDKWLRPRAWCPGCDEVVSAIQVFKNPRKDMGRYRQQYLYRCPRVTCRNAVVEPAVLPATTAIDFSLPTRKVGDGKPGKKFTPYAPATIARIKAGMEQYWVPLLVPAGGTWRDRAIPVTVPMPTRTTSENDGLALPPLMVPVEGREGKAAAPGCEPIRTQTTRNETGIAFPPLMIPMRGGGDKERARRADLTAMHAVTAGGNHHGLVTWEEQHLLVPYYSSSDARPVTEPVGTLTTVDRYGLAGPALDVNEVEFRMLEPHEIGRGMAFASNYVVVGNKRQKVRQYGGAVTPPIAEIIVSALVECVTGESLERAA
ncbi:DNA cytosine methyltransferase [Actinomadura sp. ATCC 39365]